MSFSPRLPTLRGFWLIGILVLAACGTTPGTLSEDTPDTADATPPSSDAPAGELTELTSTVWPTDPRVDPHHEWTVEIVATIDHDPTAYTQGLEVADGRLLESTGLYGESSLVEFGSVGTEQTRRVELEADLFGEGLTVVGGEVIQLTLKAQRALRWDAETLKLLGEFAYEGEGWGICLSTDRLIMSNGSATLVHRDPDTFEIVAEVEVRRGDKSVGRLNELECVDGLVFANVYLTDDIIVVNPTTGEVLATIDAGVLAATIGSVGSGEVLNGVADLGDGTLLLGGKNWPSHFVVRLIEG